MSLDDYARVVLTENEKLQRFAALGDWSTAGPEPHPSVVEVVPVPHPKWSNGWYNFACDRKANPGRIGGVINPFAIVVHTCDMLHEEFFSLVEAVEKRKGAGNAFHFVIGPTAHEGIVQMVPIGRNANHAGGPEHGSLVDARGRSYHPNVATVGIEFHCAGGVRLVGGEWRLVEGGKAHGKPIPRGEVTPDPKRPGRGWHNLTEYQWARYVELREALETQLATMPAGLHSVSRFERAASWSTMIGRVAFHSGLDAKNRSDPWPVIAARVRRHEESIGA